jgi:hypothetical protein
LLIGITIGIGPLTRYIRWICWGTPVRSLW